MAHLVFRQPLVHKKKGRARGSHHDRAAVLVASPPLAPLIRRDILPSAFGAMPILSFALCDFRTPTELRTQCPRWLPCHAAAAACSLSAALHNWGYCVLCFQKWYPQEFDNNGRPAANRRGHALFDPQFQRKYNENPTTCVCSKAICESIGFLLSLQFKTCT